VAPLWDVLLGQVRYGPNDFSVSHDGSPVGVPPSGSTGEDVVATPSALREALVGTPRLTMSRLNAFTHNVRLVMLIRLVPVAV
jgi:hypothetical protein